LINSIPKGLPTEDNFKVEEKELPSIRDGELSFESLFISPDPYQRTALLRGQVKEGDTMCGTSVVRVLESKMSDFKKGDILVVCKGWVSHGILTKDDLQHVRRHNTEYGPPSTALGVLGMTGLTAYFGVTRILKPKENQTILVSGACGAVGSLAGQICRIMGCRVIGIVSTEEKRDVLKGLGFTETINYKDCSDLEARIRELSPDGVDGYFDTVGGRLLDCVLECLKPRARIALCGQSSLYNQEDLMSEKGPRYVLSNLIFKNARMEGFVYTRWANEFDDAIKTLAGWLKDGRLKYKETITEGSLDVTPKAFISMMKGKSIGKQLVKLPSSPSQ
jgi:NADPH-dependent curcumin reductase CurA